MSRLEIARRNARLTQRQLAARAGIDYRYVSLLEHGYCPTRGRCRVAVARVLGLDPDELFDVEGGSPEAG